MRMIGFFNSLGDRRSSPAAVAGQGRTNVYAYADASSPVIEKLAQWWAVEITGEERAYYRVVTPQGHLGYIDKQVTWSPMRR